MQLTKQQIEKLRIHLEESGFKYIDVQIEILDHVATAVEERMTENTNLTFQDAVNQTQSSFGTKGFKQVEVSIIKGISSRYNKLFLEKFISLLNYKYIVLVLFSILLLYKVQGLIGDQGRFLTLTILGHIMLLVASLTSKLKTTAFKKYMLYKSSELYLRYKDIFLSVIIVYLYAFNASYLFTSVAITLYGLYHISAIGIAKRGILESRQLREKFNLIDTNKEIFRISRHSD